jgi:hypothetical protein
MEFNNDISNVVVKTKFDCLGMYALANEMSIRESCYNDLLL